jgi:STAS-like domain of unknown function (DUF4325)
VSVRIEIPGGSSGFQEDKDLAKTIRQEQLLPALAKSEDVVLDFRLVGSATQSFIHALVGGALQQYGEVILDHISFQDCSAQLRNVIELVVNYSLGGFAEPEAKTSSQPRPNSA